jgi:hypothetical protein
MEVFSFPLNPGHWYVLITCEKCNTEHVLFPDLTHGKATLIATYSWTCSTCGHRGNYDGSALRRYQHEDEQKRL